MTTKKTKKVKKSTAGSRPDGRVRTERILLALTPEESEQLSKRCLETNLQRGTWCRFAVMKALGFDPAGLSK